MLDGQEVRSNTIIHSLFLSLLEQGGLLLNVQAFKVESGICHL